jgi:RimJ/RimL family protein N-acetyltransferase
MNEDLLQGKLVRFKAVDPQTMAEAYSRWSRDSWYWRLMSGEPAYPMSVKSTQEWLEEELYKDPPGFILFAIHTLADDRLIGEAGFEDDYAAPGESFIIVGIGEEPDWGKGFGSDAMRILLRYAFMELSLRRISLTVSEYNLRGIQSDRKVGFVEEGRLRGGELRDGRRYDLIYMGILKEEWEKIQGEG